MKLQACILCLIVFSENFLPVFFKAQDHIWERCSVISARAMTEPEQPWQDQGGLLQIESTALGACVREIVAWGGQAVQRGSGCGAFDRLVQERGVQLGLDGWTVLQACGGGEWCDLQD